MAISLLKPITHLFLEVGKVETDPKSRGESESRDFHLRREPLRCGGCNGAPFAGANGVGPTDTPRQTRPSTTNEFCANGSLPPSRLERLVPPRPPIVPTVGRIGLEWSRERRGAERQPRQSLDESVSSCNSSHSVFVPHWTRRSTGAIISPDVAQPSQRIPSADRRWTRSGWHQHFR